MDDLKNCPFCGKAAYTYDDCNHSTAVYVTCGDDDCLASDLWFETVAEAIAAWNRRAAPSAPAEVEGLVRAHLSKVDGTVRGAFHRETAERLTALQAEIERLKQERETAINNARHYADLCEKAEAERDEALAAVAYERAADACANYPREAEMRSVMVKRFILVDKHLSEGGGGYMEPDDQGEWVRFSDAQAALAEIVDAETRKCAELMQPTLRSMMSRGEAYRTILARIDQRKGAGAND